MKRPLLAALSLVAVIGMPEPTDACSIATTPTIGFIPGCTGSACAGPLPRNAVFFTNTVVIEGVSTTTEPVAGEIFRALPDLPVEGSVVAVGTLETSVGAAVDTVEPTAPVILSARQHTTEASGPFSCHPSTCANVTTFVLEMTPSSDETATAGHLTYELYFASSAAAASDLANPSSRVLPTIAAEGTATVVLPVAPAAYVAVAALDQAGNRSPRSAPHRVSH